VGILAVACGRGEEAHPTSGRRDACREYAHVLSVCQGEWRGDTSEVARRQAEAEMAILDQTSRNPETQALMVARCEQMLQMRRSDPSCARALKGE
jgi:hypothetical protein